MAQRINKPNTTDKKRKTASFISHADLISPNGNTEDYIPYVTFTEKGTSNSVSLPIGKDAFARVRNGVGIKHPDMRKGMRASLHFEIQLLLDKNTNPLSQKPQEVCNVIAYPTQEYTQCDINATLHRSYADPNDILVQIFSNGDFIVYSFPPKQYKTAMQAFISALEQLTKIAPGVTFSTKTSKYTVESVIDTMVTITMHNKS